MLTLDSETAKRNAIAFQRSDKVYPSTVRKQTLKLFNSMLRYKQKHYPDPFAANLPLGELVCLGYALALAQSDWPHAAYSYRLFDDLDSELRFGLKATIESLGLVLHDTVRES